MKTMVLEEGPDPMGLRLVERDMPVPGPTEVLIQVQAAALNYRDLEIATRRYHTAFKWPLVPLSDCAGTVVSVGAAVTRIKVDDRVCSTFWRRWISGGFENAEPHFQGGGPLDGVLSEYVCLDEQAVVIAPTHLSAVEASTLPCAGVTAFQSLVVEGRLQPGETVLVQGTGGVSVFALQFARLAGAEVIVTSGSDEKIARAVTLGARAGINYRRCSQWADEVLALTSGRGVDHIIEVGGPSTFAQSLKAIRVGGRIHVVGYLGGSTGSIDPLEIFRRHVSVKGIAVGPRSTLEALTRAIEVTAMRPVVDSVFDWRDAREAFDLLASGGHFGKIVLAVQ